MRNCRNPTLMPHGSLVTKGRGFSLLPNSAIIKGEKSTLESLKAKPVGPTEDFLKIQEYAKERDDLFRSELNSYPPFKEIIANFPAYQYNVISNLKISPKIQKLSSTEIDAKDLTQLKFRLITDTSLCFKVPLDKCLLKLVRELKQNVLSQLNLSHSSHFK